MKDIGEFLTSGVLPLDAALTIVEIGAHIGSDSAKLRQLFRAARIVCFEPDPRNVYAFKRAGTHKVVTLIEAAVGDRDGEAVFHLSAGAAPKGHPLRSEIGAGPWTYSSSLKRPVEHLSAFPWVKFEQTAKVRIVRLDTFVREAGIGTIDFLWADVQGAEDQLIAGAQQALARTRYLYTEFSDRQLYEGQIGLAQILDRLPGGPDAWELLAKFDEDVLLRNRAFEVGRG